MRLLRAVSDPIYWRMLLRRMRTGNIAPGMEVFIWQLCVGKPKEIIETNAPTAVNIIHKFWTAAKDAAASGEPEGSVPGAPPRS